MALHKLPAYRLTRSFALPLRSGWRWSGFILLAVLSAWLLLLSQFKPQLIVPVRVHVVDQITPVLDALSQPADLVRSAMTTWEEWVDLRATVQQLRAENARLKSWEQAGLALQTENRDLKQLLQFHAEPTATSLTARVIATTGAPFAASMIVTAGSRDGVQKNMAAVTGDGLIGRVIEVGEWSARILLVTDPESRTPVVIADNGTRAILAGNGGHSLEPRFLPADAAMPVGTRFVTSGHGGLLPPHLAVGVVQKDDKGRTEIYPIADPTKVNYVRLIDFNLAGGAANAQGAALTATP